MGSPIKKIIHKIPGEDQANAEKQADRVFLFEILINSLEEAVILFDKNSVVRFVNRSGEEFFGRSLNEVVGKKFKELFPEEKNLAKLIKKAIAEERLLSSKRLDINIGRILNVDLNISPFFIGGENKGAVLSVRENNEIALKEDYEFDSLVYLLGTIAHEIKNPLGGIKGAAQLLKNRAHGSGLVEYAGLIIKETDRLDSVLQNYLTISKKPLFHPTNVHEILEKAASIMAIPIKDKKITLRKVYDLSLPGVLGDEGKLLQVFLNIIKNAVEAMQQKGTLTISTGVSREYVRHMGKPKRWAVISIADTGAGIPAEDIQKIFMPFYTKKKHGTGLGLALSKKIISDHQGFIKVESRMNKGATFNVYIPFEGK